jgi:ferredoxin-NADP reductase
MSMLRTFADREDCRDLRLIYMNISLDDVIFHDELSALDQRLNLTLTHVLEEPPEGWEGETGLLDRELLERHLPEDREAYEYFICGPKPMMDIAEASLLEMGIRQRRILSERFNMV